nr:ergothioneine biosynthesis protein EgtB [Bordetella genomosp. 12]
MRPFAADPLSCALTHPLPAAPPADSAARLLHLRAATEALAAPLSPEDCQAQSMPDCSPVKWHLAHTTWFFETFILARQDPGYRPRHPEYRVLFNSYYQSVGDRHPRPQRGLLTRPSLDAVMAYRHEVEQAVANLLARRPDDPALHHMVELGMNHEEQHQELILTDLKHLLSCNPCLPAYLPAPVLTLPPGTPAGWTYYAGGQTRIGHTGPGFAFDNEGPAHDVLLPPFHLANRLVTQHEYLQFILDGGYRRPELWLSQGWDLVCAQGWRAPLYWQGQKDEWQAFTLAGLQALDLQAPVCHVSYFEADAYARWARVRLPREAEWELAARRHAGAAPNLLESGRFAPCPAPRPGMAGGPVQFFGDVWEWTASAYDAYPGFKPAAGAIGEYNGKFMCNQYVLRGGSCVTPARHIRNSYRNFFPPEARWQFSGIRLARDN